MPAPAEPRVALSRRARCPRAGVGTANSTVAPVTRPARARGASRQGASAVLRLRRPGRASSRPSATEARIAAFTRR